MYCYDLNGELLGVVSCIPQEGEEHLWGDTLYVCTGDVTTNKGCRENGMIFKKVNKVSGYELSVIFDKSEKMTDEETEELSKKIFELLDSSESVSIKLEPILD